MLDLGVLLRVPCVEVEMGFDISPDGQRAAFSWNPDGRWEIYEISLRSSPGSRTRRGESAPRLVSHGPGAKFHPRYSPDGCHLAFVVDLDGSENFHILLHDFATTKQTDLTPGVSCALQASFVWSPDGRQIAFISDQSGRFNVYLM
jgi:TolB protein